MKSLNQDLLTNIFSEIYNNGYVTEKSLATKFSYSERTIRRYLKILKENNYIMLLGSGKKRKWIILKKYSN